MQTEQIRELAERRGFPKVSLYFSTVMKGPETRQNSIHLKNALSDARRQLEHAGMDGREIDALFAEAMEKLDDEGFWAHQSRGLGVFIEEGRTLWRQLPGPVEELAVVADRYHVRPLLNAAEAGGTIFYLLAITRDRVAFYEGNESELEAVGVPDCPESIAELRGKTEFEGNVGFHANERGGRAGGEGAPQYHGQGRSAEDYGAVLLEHFLRDVANAVDARLANATAPLVLAADPRAAGHIRGHLKYDGLAEQAIARNPESMSLEQLHEAAAALLEPEFAADREEAMERLEASLNDGGIPGSRDLKELVRAGVEGRVETLFVSQDAHIWGNYDKSSHDISVADEPDADNLDLLDFLAVKTLSNGGRVYPIPESKEKALGPAAGVFRY